MKQSLVPLVFALSFLEPVLSASGAVSSLAGAADAMGSPEAARHAEALAYLLKKTSKYDVGNYQHRAVIERTDDGGAWAGWIVREPKAEAVSVVSGVGKRWPMQRLDKAGHFGLVRRFKVMEGAEYRFDVDGVREGGGKLHRFGFERYDWAPDSVARDGVPKEIVHAMGVHRSTKVYAGMERKWWVYEPAGLSAWAAKGQQAKLIVVNDGEWFYKGDGSVCTVLDNLIAQGKIPPVVAVFLNPGGTKGERQNRRTSTILAPRVMLRFWRRRSCRWWRRGGR